MWSNYHSHCNYCDGKGQLADYAAKAESVGMKSIGFSSHAPVPFDLTWAMSMADLQSYLSEIEALQKTSSIQLYKGLEIDFIPGRVSPNDFKSKLDYTIGSVHFVDYFPDGRPWEIDGSPIVFRDGLNQIFNGSFRDAVTRYFELTLQMIDKACPTIIGHLDKIKIQNHDGQFFSESDSWYQHSVTEVLNKIADSGAIVEINTRGLYQRKSHTPYPSPWVIELMRLRHIPITLCSDAHTPDDLINQFPETAALLFTLGYRKISILRDGSWESVNLTPDGLV
ncbi:MAG TPA: histidinol-phosphatase [Chryseosolibacter sp.]